MYRTLRYIHLLSGLFAVSMLLMYGVSAVQMAHPTWIALRPVVRERTAALAPGMAGARLVMRELFAQGVRGELLSASDIAAGYTLVVGLPGTEHQISYDRTSGKTQIRTSIRSFAGVLNRLHHAAGFWHESRGMKMWAGMVAATSAALLLMGLTGLWMWFARKQDRLIGVLLLTGNLAFAIVMLALLRQAGP